MIEELTDSIYYQLTPAEKIRDAYYDEHVAPVLAKLSRDCTDNGLSLLAVVEIGKSKSGESKYGRTLGMHANASMSFRWFDFFVRINASFERYVMVFTRDLVSNKVPHSSIFLKKLGIHEDPEKR